MKAHLLVVGKGVLADHVNKLLDASSWCEVTQLESKFLLDRQRASSPPSHVSFAMVLHDTWDVSTHVAAETVLRQWEIPWLRGFVRFGYSVIGPLVSPGKPGCSQCADWRLMMAEDHRREMVQLREQLSASGGFTRDAWASRSGMLQTALLLVGEVQKFLTAPRGAAVGAAKSSTMTAARADLSEASFSKLDVKGTDSKETSLEWPFTESTLQSHVVLLQLNNLQMSKHFILPHAACTFCGALPDDSKELAAIQLQPTLKEREDQFRTKSIHEMEENLRHDYLDTRCGLFNEQVQDLITPLAAVSVNLPLLVGDEGTSGRDRSYRECEPIAILEGLERYCGIEPRGKRDGVFDSYANLQSDAVNPTEYGLHSAYQYSLPNFPFRPFDKDRAIDWVWGYSLTKSRPVLVPKRIAYYSLGYSDGFVYETSNGCALGGTLVEAIFHGILEVVERDAFLITWYARLPLPAVDLTGHPDAELQWMIQRIQSVAGYDLHCFNATMENGIPSVFVIAKNRRSYGLNLLCSAGSHIDPLRAIKSALHETAGMLLRFDEKMEVEKEKYRQMLQDSSRVHHMEDHSMLYGLPEAMDRLHFLLDENRPVQTFEQAFRWDKKHLHLNEDLNDLLRIFQRLNMEVVVVNQTSTEIARNGLHCVKVIIPGMVPMTFGHHLTRLENLNRILTVPSELGYTDQPLNRTELNPYPHPFP